MSFPELSERERRVLEAVIQSYVETAEPAGSRTLSRRFGLGVSPATIRNTMSDLEEKGFLFHPHTSAGRIPTDKAYRVYVEAQGEIADLALAQVAFVLNERLAGRTLRDIRTSLASRLRDSVSAPGADELLNIFIEEGEQLFEAGIPAAEDGVVLGQASVLAEQPEFAQRDSIRRLLALTETPARLAEALRKRSMGQGISITIGNEHNDP